MSDQVRTSEVMIGFLCGAAVGVGIALLTAPSSGEKTRRRIGIAARNLAETVSGRFDRMRGGVGELRRDFNGSLAHGAEEIEATYPVFVG